MQGKSSSSTDFPALRKAVRTLYAIFMPLRYSILLLLIPTLVSACIGSTNKKKYSVTTYFISLDSSSNSMGKAGQRFKYSYEEFNADSNIVYQELYATTDNFGDMWGKLLERTKFYYEGTQKTKAEREFGIAYPPSEIARGKGKEIYSYEYKDGRLVKWLSDSKPIEEYRYDRQGNQVEKIVINGLNIPEYYRFTYSNGIKTGSQYFVADTLVRVDTFLYDNYKRLIENYTYNHKGEKAAHKLLIRNEKGQAVEEKWREGYDRWRMRNNGQIIEDEFYQANKYYYDSKGRPLKTESYDLGKLMTIYEVRYD